MRGQRFGRDDDVTEEGCEFKIKIGTTGYMLVSRWRKTAEVYED
jgi:hypothetical protein